MRQEDVRVAIKFIMAIVKEALKFLLGSVPVNFIRGAAEGAVDMDANTQRVKVADLVAKFGGATHP